MKIELWVNGRRIGTIRQDVAVKLAEALYSRKWDVHELYDIGKIVIFSPQIETHKAVN